MPDNLYELAQFVELAVKLGWTKDDGRTSYQFLDEELTRLLDLHDAVKMKARECKNCNDEPCSVCGHTQRRDRH